MKIEEAIKLLKSKMEGSVDTSYKWCEAVRLAISALKKQEEKKPIKIMGSTYTKCPVCGSRKMDDYCSKCGQKIDWEE